MQKAEEARSPAFIHAGEQAVDELEPGIRRQMLGYGPDLMLCLVWFESGAVGQVHSHFHSQSSYIESGRFLVIIDGEERELGAGDSYYVAPNLLHGATCIEAGALIDTFSPARADFLGRVA